MKPRRATLGPERIVSQRIPRQRLPDTGGVYGGTVGHNNGTPHFDKEDGQVTLLKVTLFAGHNPVTEGENPDPARARGQEILVRIDPETEGVPDDGTHVIVAHCAGQGDGPGAWSLLKCSRPAPKWIPNGKSGERIIFGPNDSFIRFKDDGTIFMFVKNGDADTGKPSQVKLGPKGWQVDHPHGRGRVDELGFELSHSSGAMVAGGSISGLPAPLDAFSSFLSLRAALVKVESAAIALGLPASTPDALMKAVPTLGTMTAVGAALASLIPALTAIEADIAAHGLALDPPIPATSTAPVGAANIALTAANTPIANLPLTAPTKGLTGA